MLSLGALAKISGNGQKVTKFVLWEYESPSTSTYRRTLARFSLGHELITDVVRLQFPQPTEEWEAYSVA